MSALKPDTVDKHTLGTSDLPWQSLHVDALAIGARSTGANVPSGTEVVIGSSSKLDGGTSVDVEIHGSLTVHGSTQTVSATNTVIADRLIELGNGTTGAPAHDTGIVLERGDSDNAFIGFDESTDKFTVGTGSFTGASTGNLTITAGDFIAANVEATTAVIPDANSGASLGTTSLGWSDLYIAEDGEIQLGDDQEVKLTHIPDTGVRLNGAMKLQFRDATEFVHSDADGFMHMEGATGVNLAVNGNDEIAVTATESTFGGNIVIPDGGQIGSASDANALTISDAGQINVTATTEATSTNDGALAVAGGLSVANSVVVGNDLDLLSNGAILKVGALQPFTLTHTNANNTLLATADHRLAFGDAGEYISGDGTDLKIVSSGDVDITGDTDVVGGLSSTGTTTLASASGLTTIGSSDAAVFTGAGRLLINNTTDATSTIDGSLQTDGGLSVAKDAVIGNDLKLLSDGAVISLGEGSDATLTHDNTTGLTIAATPISIDSTGELHLNSSSGDIKLQEAGSDKLHVDLISGHVIMKLMSDEDDFVFQQFDGTEVIRVEDNGDFDVAGGAGNSGVTITSAGQITSDGRVIIDDATDAATTTDGSLQTDGGLSVAKSAIVGDNLRLVSDASVFSMGAGNDVTITHDNATGATLASAGAFLIDGGNSLNIDATTSLTVGAASINIDADGGNGSGAIEIDTNDTTNGVKIGVGTSGMPITLGHSTSEVTVGDNLTVTGNLTVNGDTVTVNSTTVTIDDPIFTLGGDTAPGSDDNKDRGIEFRYYDSEARVGFMGWDDSASGFTLLSAATNNSEVFSGTAAPLVIGGLTSSTVTASGIIKTDDDTEATTTTDGSLQTDGGLSVVKSAVIGDDLDLLSNGAILSIGDSSKFVLTDQNSNNTVMASSGHRLAFGDAGEYISGDGTDLKIVSSGDVDITGDTDVVGGLSSTQATVLASAAGTTTIGSSTAAVFTAAGALQVNNTTEATTTTDGSLQTDGGLSVAKSAVIGDDLDLLSNSAVFKVGSDQPFTLTHANANNTLLASADHRLAFGDAGEYIAGDGTNLSIVSSGTVEVTGNTNVTGGVSSTQATVLASAAGTTTIGSTTGAVFTAAGALQVNNATEATTTTDGSLQTDGGLSVAKSAVIGDDLDLLSDGAILSFGAGQDVSLTHVHDTGLLLNSNMQLQFRDATEYIQSDADGDLMVRAGTTVNLNVNGTDELSVTSSAATFGGNIVIPNNGSIGVATQTDAIAISATGVVTIGDNTTSSDKDTGALVVEGGVGIEGALHVGSSTGASIIGTDSNSGGYIFDLSGNEFRARGQQVTVQDSNGDDKIVLKTNGDAEFTGDVTFDKDVDLGNSASSDTTNVNSRLNVKGRLVLGDSSSIKVTLSSNAFTATQAYHRVEVEGASGDDDLTTINGGIDGMTLTIQAFHTDRTVTVSHGGGNIMLNGGSSFALDNTNCTLSLIYNGSTNLWCETGRSDV